MKKILLVVALLAIPSLAHAQSQTAHPGDAIAWWIPDSELALPVLVDHFNVCYDEATTCTTVPLTAKYTDIGTPANASAYKAVISNFAANSNHNVTVASCNLEGCGPATRPLEFIFSLAPPKTAPQNLHIKVGG